MIGKGVIQRNAGEGERREEPAQEETCKGVFPSLSVIFISGFSANKTVKQSTWPEKKNKKKINEKGVNKEKQKRREKKREKRAKKKPE